MGKLPYEKNIITRNLEYTAEQMEGIEKFREEHPFKSTVGMERLLWIDGTFVQGAEFYMECIWLWPGKTPEGTMEEPHAHPFPEVIGFIGTDPDHPHDLDGRMEIHIGDEVLDITKSSLVFLPPGLHHGPLTFREVNRPTFFFTLAPVSRYGRKSDQMDPEGTRNVKIPEFKAPPKDKNGSRYARFIVTEPLSHISENDTGARLPHDAKSTHVVSLDGSVHAGAFHVDFVWIWNGSLTMAPQTHAHDWDEMIGLVGYPDKKNPRAIDKGLSVKMGEDMYQMEKSSLIYVPKNVPHAPIIFKDIKKPVLCFTIGTAPKWTEVKKKKAAAKVTVKGGTKAKTKSKKIKSISPIK